MLNADMKTTSKFRAKHKHPKKRRVPLKTQLRRIKTQMYQQDATRARADERRLIGPPEYMVFVNAMTNWQRSQWARAGYPKEFVSQFSELIHRGALD